LRLVTYTGDEGARVGVRVEGGVAPTAYTDMRALIAEGEPALERVRAEASRAGVVAEPQLLAPIPRPEKIFGSGINYVSHGDEEPDGWLPEVPFFFSKLPSAVVGPGEPIVLPRRGLQVDYEVELAVVIGSRARHVGEERAMEHVFGYTLMNDVSSRAIQFKEEQPGDRQITIGKGLDSFAPLGPEIVLTDEIEDFDALQVKAYVNGELRQDESVSQQRFTIPQVIAWLSSLVTLEPGDVISTGTPGGVGSFRSPPVFLEPGDVVTVAETTIGELTNPVEAGPGYHELPEWPTPWVPGH
jgi:2,4-diketo-3-deoxy-L-fuconate hydrolase